MLPQHGGVPNFKLRLSGPFLILLALVLITGLLLTLSFYLKATPGDVSAQNRATLSLIITLLLSFFVLLAASGRMLHPHLWRQGGPRRGYHHRRRHHHHH